MSSAAVGFTQVSPPPPPQWRPQEDPFAARSVPNVHADMRLRGLRVGWVAGAPSEDARPVSANASGHRPGPSPHLILEHLFQIRQSYAVVGETGVLKAALEQLPTLYPLLREAVGPLQNAFGSGKLLQLEPLESDDGVVLRVIVKLPSGTNAPAEMMRQFKKDWWLKNCSRSGASLVFDYETDNAF